MPYIIDGHNLIPNVPGLSLRAIDDEERLIRMLQVFCRKQRQTVEVYFDRAAPGHSGKRSFGCVAAIFVVEGQTADHAIRLRLKKLGKNARSWKVVSSDHQVQAEARYYQAERVESAAFAQQLVRIVESSDPDTGGATQRMSESEIEEWLRLFQQRKDKK